MRNSPESQLLLSVSEIGYLAFSVQDEFHDVPAADNAHQFAVSHNGDSADMAFNKKFAHVDRVIVFFKTDHFRRHIIFN
jgi:hypothetical protein